MRLYKYTAISIRNTENFSHTVARNRQHCIPSPRRFDGSPSTQICRRALPSAAREAAATAPSPPAPRKSLRAKREMRAERFDVRRKSRRDGSLAERNRQLGCRRRIPAGRGAENFWRLPVFERIERQSHRSAAQGRRCRAQGIEPRRFDRADETQRGVQVFRARGLRPELSDQRRDLRRQRGVLFQGGLQREEQPQHVHTGFGIARSRFSAYSTDWRRTASRFPSN